MMLNKLKKLGYKNFHRNKLHKETRCRYKQFFCFEHCNAHDENYDHFGYKFSCFQRVHLPYPSTLLFNMVMR